MNKDFIIAGLDKIIPNPKCELIYNKDYELLIATMLSAQSTDKRVNEVTEKLFSKYDLIGLNKANINDIEKIIMPVGTWRRKAIYVKEIAKALINKYQGTVPKDYESLESIPGVGHKTANVVLGHLYNIPSFAVDTHVTRVAKIMGLATKKDDVIKIEKKLNKFFPKEVWNQVNDQMVLFGRYYCKAKKPLCDGCPFKGYCLNTKKAN
jgi:endonuclease-3